MSEQAGEICNDTFHKILLTVQISAIAMLHTVTAVMGRNDGRHIQQPGGY